MTSFRYYLVDALIRWLLDNDCIPHVIIQCDLPTVRVPAEYVHDNRLVLNVAPSAVQNYSLTESSISLEARFQGIAHHISAPVGAIIGVCARGSSVGMMFEPEGLETENQSGTIPDVHQQARSRFKVVE